MIEPDRTQHVTLRIKKSVLDHFKAGGKKGYQTRINAVLESYCASTGKKTAMTTRAGETPCLAFLHVLC
ncbi:MAG: BrnA antitoxin family protein [Proteobacteria bacterium]|nr:BrnA antitoxin family protein [Pseudomonadota bacterium]